MEMLENFTFDELQIGQSASLVRSITEDDLRLFAAVSGDLNPLHLDEAWAQTTPFKGRIAHGMFTGALISAAIAMLLPGPGAVYRGQELRFDRPVRIGDVITVELTVKEKIPDENLVVIDCVARNQRRKVVVAGQATVVAPTEKLRAPKPAAPAVELLPSEGG